MKFPPETRLPVAYSELSWDQRRAVRERYIELQDGDCFYCDEFLSEDPALRVLSTPIDHSLFPPNFLEHPIHLQHDHKTDMTEGAVHAYCNAVMWQYEGR